MTSNWTIFDILVLFDAWKVKNEKDLNVLCFHHHLLNFSSLFSFYFFWLVFYVSILGDQIGKKTRTYLASLLWNFCLEDKVKFGRSHFFTFIFMFSRGEKKLKKQCHLMNKGINGLLCVPFSNITFNPH